MSPDAQMDEDERLERLQELLKQLVKRLGHNDEHVNRLTLEQLEFILNDLTKASFLSSCPGSGKTEVVGFKAAYESSTWNSFNSGIAILTYTNNAASEIYKRASEYSNHKAVKFPHFVGTIDSWLHQYIFQPFCYSVMDYEGKEADTSINIIDPNSKAPFLKAYKTKISDPPNYNEININEFSLISDEEPLKFDRDYTPSLCPILVSKLKESKKKFAQRGFATYRDAEYWSYQLLHSNHGLLKLMAKRFPYIIIDECQDLPPTKLKLLELLRNEGVVLHFIGDLNQSIYDFIDVSPEGIKEFITNSRMINFKLTRNFRSNQNIVNLCAKLVGSEDIPDGRSLLTSFNSCIFWEYRAEQIHTLPSSFEKYLKANNINCNNCSILVRGKALIDKLKKENTDEDSISFDIAKAYFIYRSDWKCLESITTSLNLLGKSICNLVYDGKGNHQKHYCPECFHSIRWKLLLIDILNTSNEIACFTKGDSLQTWSDWCLSLKDILSNYIGRLSIGWDKAKRKIKAPPGKRNELVIDSFPSSLSTSSIRITTIHDVKGETFDAVMLVSSADKRSKGGYFEHWFEDTNSEYARFAYVACSRPRDLLIIAVPTLNEAQKAKLQSMGLISSGPLGTLSQWF